MSDSPTSSSSSKDSIDARSTVAEEYEILEIEFYLFKAGFHEVVVNDATIEVIPVA